MNFQRMTEAVRRALMAKIQRKDTKPEITVRRVAHALGYRFRLHRRDLPGSPDLVFPRKRKVIFVHGCFWHRHDCPAGQKVPGKNLQYWLPKLERNRQRDAENLAALKGLGWDSLVVWECQARDLGWLSARIREFLGSD